MSFYTVFVFSLSLLFLAGMFGVVTAIACFVAGWIWRGLFALAAGLALLTVSGRWLYVILFGG